MIITVPHLKLIHYFYFAMGIFGLTSVFFVELDSMLALVFAGFYVSNSVVSWFMAYVARKKMSQFVVVESPGFFIRHFLLTVFTVLVTAMIWIYGINLDIQILNNFLMANYFVLFIAGMWYAISRADFAKELFTIYDNYVFRKAKDLIIRLKEKYSSFFGRSLVEKENIRNYGFGTIKEVDDNLISAWKNRKKLQYALECLGRIELAMARELLNSIRERLNTLRLMPGSPERMKEISHAENEFEREKKEIMDYEKVFYTKTGESEFL